MKEYHEDINVERIADEVIKDFVFPEQPLIKYLKLAAEKCSYLGKCSLATGKWKYLIDKDFVVEVWGKWWDEATDVQKRALLYHELSHIGYKEKGDGEIVWKVKEHDVEEFQDVVKKYGPWLKSLEAFKENLNKKG